MGRESPAELKAAKLARGRARGLEDRGLKPNTAEREAIEAVIKAPSNRCTLMTSAWPSVMVHMHTFFAVLPGDQQCCMMAKGFTAGAVDNPTCKFIAFHQRQSHLSVYRQHAFALVGMRDQFTPVLLRAAC